MRRSWCRLNGLTDVAKGGKALWQWEKSTEGTTGRIDENFWDYYIYYQNEVEGKEKRGRIKGEKVNMMMMMMMMRSWRVILKLVCYMNLLICKHKTFRKKKNNCQYSVQLNSPFDDTDNN
jgi:hypothetical protein